MSNLQLLMPGVHLREITITCASCDTVEVHDYLVGDADDQETLFGYARTYLTAEKDWSCSRWGDFCLACTQRWEDT